MGVGVAVVLAEVLPRSNLYIFFRPIFVIKEQPLVEESRAKSKNARGGESVDAAGGIRPWLPLVRRGLAGTRPLRYTLPPNQIHRAATPIDRERDTLTERFF